VATSALPKKTRLLANTALPDLDLVVGVFVFCCLPVTRISAPRNLRLRAKASWKWQLLLLGVPHSAERWVVVR
jgi:hypothetical protein